MDHVCSVPMDQPMPEKKEVKVPDLATPLVLCQNMGKGLIINWTVAQG